MHRSARIGEASRHRAVSTESEALDAGASAPYLSPFGPVWTAPQRSPIVPDEVVLLPG